jgi:hypothetical protein
MNISKLIKVIIMNLINYYKIIGTSRIMNISKLIKVIIINSINNYKIIGI